MSKSYCAFKKLRLIIFYNDDVTLDPNCWTERLKDGADPKASRIVPEKNHFSAKKKVKDDNERSPLWIF